jgi:hypothetical protein
MADNSSRLQTNMPGLFSPTSIRNIQDRGDSNSNFLNKEDSSIEQNLALGSTASFKYNIQGTGLQSTQQLNVDWSDFANHTFFNSAQVKTNIAFDKIINEFPFDGTKKETEVFFDKLTGYEKWVYDQFPKNKGYMIFTGSQLLPLGGADSGTHVIVKDYAGAQFPTLSRLKTGETILDPGLKSMTVESWVYPASFDLDPTDQAIISMVSASTGYSVIAETDGLSTDVTISMIVVSGGLEDKVSLTCPREEWSHVHFSWNRTPGVHTIFGYRNNLLEASSSMPIEFGALNVGGTDMFIGSGSALGTTFAPNSTFSGSLDELRIWHSVRTSTERLEYQKKTVNADDNLKLYFRFNEPSGSNTNLVLDHSSNALHGRINARGLTLGVREMASASFAGASPMINEKLFDSPVLFPEVEASVALRSDLLTSASLFDNENPNLISRLVPPHYFQEGMRKDSLCTEEGSIVDAQDATTPRETGIGSTQVMLSLLYTWAKFFDEMKLYIQAFSTLKTVKYSDPDTIPNDFLSVFARNEGIELPPLFVGTSIEQYVEGENLEATPSRNVLGLQAIQNQVWRRILINLQDVLKSKGTLHSIKSFIRSVGINPDNNFRIREFGGPTKRVLTFNRENRFEVSSMLDFVSGGLIQSPVLSSSKVEPGWPLDGAGPANNDRMHTSGSFTFEGTYKFPLGRYYPTSQSLARFEVSSSTAFLKTSPMNLIVVSSSTGPVVTLVNNSNVTQQTELNLSITGANILDGDQWYVSMGRRRSDDPTLTSSEVSSSYFLRLAKQGNGTLVESHVTSAYYQDFSDNSVWEREGKEAFGSGSFGPNLLIGLSSLMSTDLIDSLHGRTQDFRGRVAQIRFWSKYLTEDEWPEHVLNYRSVGVTNPRKNFNFVSASVSGSWERLRIDASTDQIISKSNASGEIFLTDFTQNGSVFSGSTFEANDVVIRPERFYFSFISPKIDEGVQTNKVRVRGFESSERVTATPWADLAPVHAINPGETPSDSAKLSIDFSIVDTLDQDIMTIFGSLEEMNNILGDPELMFASDYKELEVLREVYFNKLQDKINIKGFFEFYKWFDTNIGTFVEQLVPRKTSFLGTNFVIESHFLERAKMQYQHEDIYLGEDIRSGLKDTLLLQLITGKFSRF